MEDGNEEYMYLYELHCLMVPRPERQGSLEVTAVTDTVSAFRVILVGQLQRTCPVIRESPNFFLVMIFSHYKSMSSIQTTADRSATNMTHW